MEGKRTVEEGAQFKRDAVVLIPVYQPDERLIGLLKELRLRFSRIVLVDDGSTENRSVLERAAPLVERVLVHPVNRGKGAALKTGFSWLLAQGKPVDVITADADGQHRPDDIVRVADALSSHPDSLTLGVRAFKGRVPLRSLLGNLLTRLLFFLVTRLWIVDTQTGLRGIPASLLARIAALPGDRYEYEMAMLVDAKDHPRRPFQVAIETVYVADNAGSHFNPVLDAIRIYRSLFQFCLSSVLCFLVDNIIFALAIGVFSGCGMSRRAEILLALSIARFVSANCNFLYNRFIVFRGRATLADYFRYWALVLVILSLGYVLTDVFAEVLDVNGLVITPLKIAVETVLFLLSYFVQKRFVFR